ncbi:MAG: site-2 protease family protein [Faecalibacterium sp.]|mgnify:FL=1|nr:site-2 protease family protein [Faecalibacterium sp.]CCY03791.1 peptidase M50 family [Faecalibacterium sp. CAG:1138]
MFIIQLFQSGRSAVEIFIYLLAILGAIMVAIMCHEVAHGYVALLNGDPTAKMAGRLNFNPAKHFDPIGFLMMLFVGFGWAKPVPVDYRNFKNVKKGVLTVSLAGVGANFVIAFLCYLLGFLTYKIFGNTESSELWSRIILLFYLFFYYSVSINLSLIAFNILPLYPLDGFRVLSALAPRSKVTEFLLKYGNYILIGLVVFGTLVPSLDVLGIYVGFVSGLIEKLFSLIFGGWTF